jgi:ribonuclease HI
MPWIEALLRGQKVLARVTSGGQFVEDEGRVEIRYRPTDPKAYRAFPKNLAPVPGGRTFPDEACVPAVAAPPSADGAAPVAKKAAAKRVAKPKEPAAAPLEAPRSEHEWIAYTDGACSGNPGPAGLGVVVVGGGSVHEGFEYLGTATNNVAELTAILRAVEATPSAVKKIIVHTDSQYAIGVLSKGWRPKANVALIETIRAAISARGRGGVQLVYVPGHAGVPLNERADELAREAIRVRASRSLPALV